MRGFSANAIDKALAMVSLEEGNFKITDEAEKRTELWFSHS